MKLLRAATIAAILFGGGCAKLTLAWADLDAAGAPARPPLAAVSGVDEWRAQQAASIANALQAEVYGFMPDQSATKIVGRKVLDADAFGGAAILEEYELVAAAKFGATTRETKAFFLDVLLPKAASGPSPVVMMETFCPRWDTIPHPSIAKPAGARESDPAMRAVETYVFGRYICTPPVETILARGYAIASIYPGEAIADRREEGLTALADLAAGHDDAETRWGAIAAWGWLYSRIVDVLEADDRIDDGAIVAWGHSRYAKAALVAAAYDSRIDAVIAHQSGTGGASLNKGKKGESVREMTANYPHWFARRYAGYSGREEEMAVDQHQLLALIAPRPILLGNARRDVWSDPAGAFRAAKGADAAWRLYGAEGLTAARLDEFDPAAGISFWIRPGTHGVVKEDWPAFLDFLDAHFANAARSGA